MDKIKQKQIAAYIGTSEVFVSHLRAGKRRLSKDKAEELAMVTGISFRDLALGRGEELYKKLVMAFLQG